MDRISANLSAHIQLVVDVSLGTYFESALNLQGNRQVRDLYRDRVALEREYATKLHALAKKAAEKKAKVESEVVLGDDPTKVWDESILKQKCVFFALLITDQ